MINAAESRRGASASKRGAVQIRCGNSANGECNREREQREARWKSGGMRADESAEVGQSGGTGGKRWSREQRGTQIRSGSSTESGAHAGVGRLNRWVTSADAATAEQGREREGGRKRSGRTPSGRTATPKQWPLHLRMQWRRCLWMDCGGESAVWPTALSHQRPQLQRQVLPR